MTIATPHPEDPPYLNVSGSVLGRRWLGPTPDVERRGLGLAQRCGLPELLGRLLAARGVSVEEAPLWLEPTLKHYMPDPSSLRDMEAASARLAEAALRGERVALFGDYDVDGACSTALMSRWLAHFGVSATVYIPDRLREGYGPNVPAMTRLGATHDLVITLDCGTLAFEPIAAAREAGAEVMIVDHHLALETLPDCVAVVNPNRQDDDSEQGHLCAAGVAFLLLAATNRRLRAQGAFASRPEPNLLEELDLVALATVADVAQLRGVNRAFVRQGLKVLGRRGNLGLAALSDASRLSGAPSAYHLGYLLGPRVNAGGRVGDSGAGARLMTCADPALAAKLAADLDRWNRERQAIEADVLSQAMAQAEARWEREGPGGLVWAAGEGWHPGVIGVVAGRLKEKFDRPSLVVALEGALGKGSARSVHGVDLGSAVHAAAEKGLLVQGGGHAMAAGLTVAAERLAEATSWMEAELSRQGANRLGPRELRIDGAVTPSGATLELCESLERAGPFGAGAPSPRLAVTAARVSWPKPVGETHMRCVLTDSRGGRLEAVAFRAQETALGGFMAARSDGALVHAVGRLSADEWNGRRRVQLQIEDMAPLA
ncbi:single-stranded-DNA-specific exonuclease RecJ [Neomegalonema perideroedes]|uniref:single-stranded-DNA-specific exonuclease RecJ n=1 Tax=Neomegalonema perideroedes TaxID=217219 RepID=UPI00037D9536|nr:single-stranded-DNA-specific exonuclease RecJ [Neomegalonema perideroedes]